MGVVTPPSPTSTAGLAEDPATARVTSGAGEGRTAELERAAREHLPDLVRYVRGRFPDLRSDAEDIAQDALLAAWQARGDEPIPRRYLFTVAKHRAYDVWRKRCPVLPASDLLEELCGRAIDEPAVEVARTIDFDAFLATLPREERAVAVRQYVYRMTASQIARDMNVTHGAVKSWQDRTRKRARVRYEPERAVRTS
ncbi:sigma-70 family RNA polymerase sigma factor [Embleya sp. NPDC008237]|uniref:sigma-70 family RNA polymerase sigma factor n=1 Tax=Embleya sp. NPDC008237 TaxID=3363978 RepID=UPI0036EA7105